MKLDMKMIIFKRNNIIALLSELMSYICNILVIVILLIINIYILLFHDKSMFFIILFGLTFNIHFYVNHYK